MVFLLGKFFYFLSVWVFFNLYTTYTPYTPAKGGSGSGSEESEEQQIKSAGGLSIEYMTPLSAKHDGWYQNPLAKIPIKDLCPPKVKPEDYKGPFIDPVPCKIVDMDLPFHNDVVHQKELAKLLAKEIIEFL